MQKVESKKFSPEEYIPLLGLVMFITKAFLRYDRTKPDRYPDNFGYEALASSSAEMEKNFDALCNGVEVDTNYGIFVQRCRVASNRLYAFLVSDHEKFNKAVEQAKKRRQKREGKENLSQGYAIWIDLAFRTLIAGGIPGLFVMMLFSLFGVQISTALYGSFSAALGGLMLSVSWIFKSETEDPVQINYDYNNAIYQAERKRSRSLIQETLICYVTMAVARLELIDGAPAAIHDTDSIKVGELKQLIDNLYDAQEKGQEGSPGDLISSALQLFNKFGLFSQQSDILVLGQLLSFRSSATATKPTPPVSTRFGKALDATLEWYLEFLAFMQRFKRARNDNGAAS